MKYYKRLIMTFALILFISCALGSLLKVPSDLLVEKSEGFAEMVDYSDGAYNYGKVMRRILMIVTVVVLVLFRKSLDLNSLVTSGWRNRQDWVKFVRAGLIIGLCSIIIYSLYTYFIGVQLLEDKSRSIGQLISRPFTYLLAASLTAIFEETLFRGFIFKGLMKDFSLFVSVIISSIFYSILHFFSFKVIVPLGNEPFVGFISLVRFFAYGFSHLNTVLPFIIGLFIVGAILALVYDKTKSLYLSTGLHAGWVFGIKLSGFLLDRNKDVTGWFFGDGPIVSGVCGWIFLLAVFLFIKKVLLRVQFDK